MKIYSENHREKRVQASAFEEWFVFISQIIMYWAVLGIVLHIRVFKILRQKVPAAGSYIPGAQDKYKKHIRRCQRLRALPGE